MFIEESCLVFDVGSSSIKSGISGDEKPTLIIPSCIGSLQNSKSNEKYISKKIYEKHDIFEINYPIKRGIIENWDDFESLISFSFEKLETDPSTIPVVFSESPKNSTKQNSKIYELMFEKFNVKGFYMENSGNLVGYAAGRTSSFVLDSGEGISFCQGSHQGSVIESTLSIENFGGLDVTNYLRSLIFDEKTLHQTQMIKENFCKISKNFEESKSDGFKEEIFILPDKTLLSMGFEPFMASELLFQPDLFDLHSSGFHQMISDSILTIDDENHQQLMLNNIVLSGGNCCFDGLENRLLNELEKLFPNLTVQFVDFSKEDRKILTWIGCSIVGCLPNYQEIIMKSKSKYEEIGYIL